MYEIIKRHGETYVYQGTTCIAIATAEGEKAVEELIRRAIDNQDAIDVLRKLLNQGFEAGGKFYLPTIDNDRATALRALIDAGRTS